MTDYIILVGGVTVGGLLSYWVSHHRKRGAVFGSAIVTLSAGILLSILSANFEFPLAPELSFAMTIGGYAGMVSNKIVKNLREMTIYSLLTGMVYISAPGVLPGVGGRLGSIAALGCLVFLGGRTVLKMLIGNIQKK